MKSFDDLQVQEYCYVSLQAHLPQADSLVLLFEQSILFLDTQQVVLV